MGTWIGASSYKLSSSILDNVQNLITGDDSQSESETDTSEASENESDSLSLGSTVRRARARSISVAVRAATATRVRRTGSRAIIRITRRGVRRRPTMRRGAIRDWIARARPRVRVREALDENGNEYSGDYTSTRVDVNDGTTPISGTESHGPYSGTQIAHSTATTVDTGNNNTGEGSEYAVASSSATVTTAGGDRHDLRSHGDRYGRFDGDQCVDAIAGLHDQFGGRCQYK